MNNEDLNNEDLNDEDLDDEDLENIMSDDEPYSGDDFVNRKDFEDIIKGLNEDNSEHDMDTDNRHDHANDRRSGQNNHDTHERDSEDKDAEQDEDKKRKREGKKKDTTLRQRFLSNLKKAPVYAAGAILSIIGLARQFIRALLFGPSYARKTEEEFADKIDQLKASEKLQKENEDRQRERDGQEHDRDRDTSERDSSSDHQHEEDGEEQKEPEAENDESEENKDEADNRTIRELILGEEPAKLEDQNEKKQTHERFSVDAMTSDDIKDLLNTDGAKEALRSIEESFGVWIRFSPDMTQMNLVDANAEVSNVSAKVDENTILHYPAYPEEAISRPIDVHEFLKGNITQMAAACKDIGCELHGSSDRKSSSDARNIMAAAVITAKFRKETLADYHAGDAHKSARNNTVLAYMPKVLSIGGTKDETTQKYSMNQIEIGKDNDNGISMELEGEDKQMLGCDSIDKLCEEFTKYDCGIMPVIENLESFPEENAFTQEQMQGISTVLKALNSDDYMNAFMTAHPEMIGREDEVQEVMDELAESLRKMVISIPYGVTQSQIEACDKLIDLYKETMDLAKEREVTLDEVMDKMDQDIEESSHEEAEPESQDSDAEQENDQHEKEEQSADEEDFSL